MTTDVRVTERVERVRLSAILVGEGTQAFHTFGVASSNFEACRSATRFAGRMEPFVAIFGRSGWGKTHLLEAVSVGCDPADGAQMLSAKEWLSGRDDPVGPMILDDCLDALATPRSRHDFRCRLERRVRRGRPTLVAFTQRRLGREERAMLPVQRSWLAVELKVPSIDDRQTIVRRMAANQGMELSLPTARLIATQAGGNGHSYAGILRRLRFVKADWSSPEDALAACGLVMPYIRGRGGWDPRDAVAEAVSDAMCMMNVWDRTLHREICSHVMLHSMGMTECDAASFFATTPADVYASARSLKTADDDGPIAAMVRASKARLVQAIAEA